MYVRGYLQGSENGRVVTIDEMVYYGTKWQWYEMVMVRND
jgi:hypothetical protein